MNTRTPLPPASEAAARITWTRSGRVVLYASELLTPALGEAVGDGGVDAAVARCREAEIAHTTSAFRSLYRALFAEDLPAGPTGFPLDTSDTWEEVREWREHAGLFQVKGHRRSTRGVLHLAPDADPRAALRERVRLDLEVRLASIQAVYRSILDEGRGPPPHDAIA